jgi:Na+-driven multidrug efflux pump
VRLVRTDNWDDATRGEWEDIKRWRRVGLGTSVGIAALLVLRLLTTSFVGQIGILFRAGVIVAVTSISLRKLQSPVKPAEPHSDPGGDGEDWS